MLIGGSDWYLGKIPSSSCAFRENCSEHPKIQSLRGGHARSAGFAGAGRGAQNCDCEFKRRNRQSRVNLFEKSVLKSRASSNIGSWFTNRSGRSERSGRSGRSDRSRCSDRSLVGGSGAGHFVWRLASGDTAAVSRRPGLQRSTRAFAAMPANLRSGALQPCPLVRQLSGRLSNIDKSRIAAQTSQKLQLDLGYRTSYLTTRFA